MILRTAKYLFVLIIFTSTAKDHYQQEIDIYNKHKGESYELWLEDIIRFLDEKELSPKEYLSNAISCKGNDTWTALVTVTNAILQEWLFIELHQLATSLYYSFMLEPTQNDIVALKELLKACKERREATSVHEKIYDYAQDTLNTIQKLADHRKNFQEIEFQQANPVQPEIIATTCKTPQTPLMVLPVAVVQTQPKPNMTPAVIPAQQPEYFGGDNPFAQDVWVY